MSFCAAAPSARYRYLPSTRANGGRPIAAIPAIRIEASGRFIERASDGTEVDLGFVQLFEPAHRLVLDWYPGTDRANATRVDVRFEAVDGGTRVTVHHDAGGASLELFTRNAPAYVRSWDLVLAAVAGKTDFELL